MTMQRTFALLIGASTVALASASTAYAGAFALREQSAYGQGMSFAGVAAGGSLSSAFWNPSTISLMDGRFATESIATGIFPDFDLEPTNGSPLIQVAPGVVVTPQEAIAGQALQAGASPAVAAALAANADVAAGPSEGFGQSAFVPASYGAYRVSDRLVLGISANGPFGLVTDHEQGFAGQVYGLTSKVFSLNITPMASYQVTDYLAVGLGAQIQYFDTRLTQSTGILTDDPVAELEGDDVGYGLTAGVTLTPMAGTSIGIGFRSSITHELEGTIAGDPTLAAVGVDEVDINSELELPEQVSLGVRQQITDRFLLAGTVEWTNWSRFTTFPVLATDDVPIATPIGPVNAVSGGDELTALAFEYDDGWYFSLGGEYLATDALTLRAGVGYELSPIDDITRAVRLPDNDRLWLSAGGSYALDDKFALDLGYTYIAVEDTPIDISEGNPSFNDQVIFTGEANDGNIHILSAGFKVKFGAPEVAYVDDGIVRKY